MLAHYFYWQFVLAPLWLLRFFWTLQQGLLQLFSVRLLAVTLFAHWHKDRLAYRQGTITGLIKAAALNIISRLVGFFVRATILLAWALAEIIFLFFFVSAYLAFIVSPLIAVFALIRGLVLLII